MSREAERAVERALETWALTQGGVRLVRVRRSTGRGGAGLACANPARRPPHATGRKRWIVTTERLETLREERAYVCEECAAALAARPASR